MSSSTSCEESKCSSTLCAWSGACRRVGSSPPRPSYCLRTRLVIFPHSSKQLNQPPAQGVPPAKLAAIQSHMGGTSQKDEGSSGSSPRSEGTCLSFCDVIRFVQTFFNLFRLAVAPGKPNCDREWCSPPPKDPDMVNSIQLAGTKRTSSHRRHTKQTTPWAGPEEQSEEQRLSQTVRRLPCLVSFAF